MNLVCQEYTANIANTVQKIAIRVNMQFELRRYFNSFHCGMDEKATAEE